MAKKRGLNRGLGALLGAAGATTVEEITNPDTSSNNKALKELDVDLIQRGIYQPRVHFDENALLELADSIKAQGVVQPIVVRPIAAGRYEIIAGERRWRATQLAGLQKIPAVIKDIDDKTTAAVSLIENIQREDLNPIEESRALQRLIDEFGLTHQECADTVGRSRASVSNLLRLQDLREEVKVFLDKGEIEMGHARCLLSLSYDQQLHVAQQVIKKGLSVRETEAMARRLLNPAKKKTSGMVSDPNIETLENDLSEKLSAKVSFKHGKNGKGQLLISYNSLDELDGILDHIK
ncbi:MAG: ParB/RepB/Spo0J family partition protein [Gammaproteobacteria bacterium]|nr:ParB/RepB/Spo0J family partition protein [Gammaproteobacteria bacterium]